MGDNFLSQDEIDALVGKNNEEQEMVKLSLEEKDIIGEIGNISMSTAATTMSSLLNKKVMITTPRVSSLSFREIVKECAVPKIVAMVEFKEGLTGKNLLMMDVTDALIIADLMMGGTGKVDKKKELSELELSAVAEAMNQMIGSASTSMATMLERDIDIMPPDVEVWDTEEHIDLEKFDIKEKICKIAFDLEVEGLIESEIMQIFTKNTVDEIISSVSGEQVQEEVEEISEAIYGKSEELQEELEIREPKKEVKKEKIEVKKPVFSELEAKQTIKKPRNLDLIMDVPLELSVVLGKSKRTIKEVLSFSNGSIVELDKLADEPLEIYVNGKLIAQGEVVVINENFGVRITNILTKEERIQNL